MGPVLLFFRLHRLTPLGYSLTCHLSLFQARTGSLEPPELDTFKKQAECLKFLPEYHFGSTRKKSVPAQFFSSLVYSFWSAAFLLSDLCPDGRESSAVRSAENDGTESAESKDDAAQ